MYNILVKSMATTLVAFTLSAAFPASAHHQFLLQTYPSARSHASEVRSVKLIFEGKADALFSTVELKQADGSVVARVTQPKASREMVMVTSTLSAGTYLVEYRVLTTDGDIVKGSFRFTVDDQI